MDEHLHAVALALGVGPATIQLALERGPGRARLIADLLGITLAELVQRLDPLVEAGVSLGRALDLELLRAGEHQSCGRAVRSVRGLRATSLTTGAIFSN